MPLGEVVLKTFPFFASLTLGFSLCTALSAGAQIQTTNQCIATTQARASLTLTKAEIRNLCENNSDEVVNCTVTMMQGNHFSGNLAQSLKDCRRQFLFNYY